LLLSLSLYIIFKHQLVEHNGVMDEIAYASLDRNLNENGILRLNNSQNEYLKEAYLNKLLKIISRVVSFKRISFID
jgi:hypothetical protein